VKNLTITLDERTLEEARKHAESRGQSLNAFVRELIKRTVRRPSGKAQRLFDLMDSLPKTQVGITWKREDLYRY
jgi:hypothetical protein